ncbi:MAG: hypothetical protein IKB56_02660, partial [Clostridia bacterium]|nr:hypothetical protein [Clostridia bacterium]
NLLAGYDVTISASGSVTVGASTHGQPVLPAKGSTGAWFDIFKGTKTAATLYITSANYSGGSYAAGANNAYPAGAHESSVVTSSTKAYSDSSSVMVEYGSSSNWARTKTATLSGSSTLNISDTKVENKNGFTLGVITHFLNNGTYPGGVRHLMVLESITYTITCGTGSYRVTLNSNNPTTDTVGDGDEQTHINSTNKGNGFLNTIAVPYWHYEGYEFTGWATSASATEGNKELPLNGSTGGTTYYAIWKPVNYPLICYDVYTDDSGGTNSASEIRRAGYYIYTKGVVVQSEYDADDMNVELQATANGVEYFYGPSVNLHYGFTYLGAYTFGLPNGWNVQSQSFSDTWTPQGMDEYFNPLDTTINSTGVYYLAFAYQMDKPTSIVIEDAEVVYGTALNMNEHVTTTHGAVPSNTPKIGGLRQVNYSYVWFSEGATQGVYDNEVQFYAENGFLYAVSESGVYAVIATATITINDVALSTSIHSSTFKNEDYDGTATFTIKPIVLKSVPVNNAEIPTLYYNGQIQEFPSFGVSVDLSADDYADYTEEQKNWLVSVFETEKTGYSWYYDSNNANNGDKWGYGLKEQLIALQFTSALGTNNGANLFEPAVVNGATPFMHAGEYEVNQVDLRKYNVGDTSVNTNPNMNFVWSNSGTQSSTSYGDVKAIILPVELDIYALYSRKSFGVIDDPIVNVLEGSYERKLGYPMNGNSNLQDDPASFLFVVGLLGNDYNTYKKALASCWRREIGDDGGQGAGLYAIYFDLFNESGVASGLAGLLNDYGISISALTDTFASANGQVYNEVTYGGIDFYRVTGINDNGTPNDYTDDTFGNFSVCADTFNYLSATDSIGATFKNFEILPVVLGTPELRESSTLTYNGTFQYVEVEFGGTITNGNIQGIATQFKGIAVPDHWNELDEAGKLEYVKNNKAGAQVVGTNANDGFVDASKPAIDGKGTYNYLRFGQINAGEYSVLVVDVTNTNYKFEGYFLVEWTIEKAPISVTHSAVGSNIFGTTNYGGYSFTFGNIASGDEVGFTTTETSPNGIGFRYNNVPENKHFVGGQAYLYYGKYVGNYSVTFSAPTTIAFREGDNALYGTHADNNYKFAEDETDRDGEWEIVARQLTLSETATNTLEDMVYNYNVAKGINFTITNFYDEDFMSADVAHNLEFVNDFVNYIAIDIAVNQTANMPTFVFDSNGTGTVTYTTTAYNSATYTTSVKGITFTDGGNTYVNYSLTTKSYNYEIKPKVIRLEWILLDGSGNPIVDDNDKNVYSVEYDKVTTYTLTAGFLVGGADEYSTTDYKVYAEDYDSTTGKITITRAGTKNVGITLAGTTSASQVSNENAEEVYIVTADQIGGNYLIDNSDTEDEGKQSQTWEIRRKVINGIDFGPERGAVYDYNGQEYSVSFNLNLIEGDTISNFTADEIDMVTNAEARITTTGYTFVGKNAGVYTLIASTTNKKIDRNYILSFTANFDEKNPLFTIRPRVLSFDFTSTTATYSASAIESFVATANLVAGDDLSWEYVYTVKEVYGSWTTIGAEVSSIVNAGVYTVSIKKGVGEDIDQYLTGESASNYTLNGATEISADCTVNRYTVSIDASVIIVPVAPNNTYNGGTYYVNFASIAQYLLDGTGTNPNNDKTEATYSWEVAGDLSAVNADTYSTTISGINKNDRGEDNYELAQSVSADWEIVKRELTIEWVPFNTYYYNSSNLANKGGAVESGNGTLGTPFQYYYNGEGALNSQDAREVGVYVIVKEGLLEGDIVQLAITEKIANTNAFYTSTFDNDLSDNTYILSASGNKITISENNVTMLIATSKAVSGNTNGLDVKVYNKDGNEEQNYTLIYKMYGSNEASDDYSSCYYNISARPVTATWSLDGSQNLSVTYDKNEHEMSATIFGMVEGVIIEPTIGGANNKTNAGTYTAEITSLNDTNHVLTAGKSQGWSISQKTISSFSWDTDTFVYDGLEHNPTATVNTVAVGSGTSTDGKAYEGDTINFTYEGDRNQVLVGDSYSIEITGIDNPNYALDTSDSSLVTKAYSITARVLNISWSAESYIEYDGTTKKITLTISNLVDTDFNTNVDFIMSVLNGKASYESVSDASVSEGIYTVSFNTKNVNDYGISVAIDTTKARSNCYALSGTTEKEWSITPKIVELNWKIDGNEVANASVEYNGVFHTITAIVSNKAVNNDEVLVTLAGDVSAKNMGIYTATAESLAGANATNYTLSGCAKTNYEWEITPKLITASWNVGAYTYNGDYQYPALSVNGLIETDTVYFAIEFYNAEGTLVVAKPVSGTGNGSYTFTSSNPNTHVQGESINAGTYSVKFNGIVYNDDTLNNAQENVNYSYNGEVNNTAYTIAKKTINGTGVWHYATATTEPNEYEHGTTQIVYSKVEYILTSALDESVLCTRVDTKVKDSVTISYEGNAQTNAGTYTAKMNLNDTNYVLGSNSTQAWTILKKEIAINWLLDGEGTLSKAYDGQNHTITATISGLLEGDTCAINLSGNLSATSVGAYTAEATSLSNNNYQIPTLKTTAWSITPRVVIITWSADSFTYDGTEKTITATIGNIVGADVCNLTISGNNATNAGEYTAQITAINNTNYTIDGAENLTHNWTINARALALSFNSASLVYNGAKQGIDLTVSNLVASDLENIGLGNFTYATQPSIDVEDGKVDGKYYMYFRAVNAGEYSVSVTAFDNDNYTINAIESSFEIARKTLTISSWNYSDGSLSGSDQFTFTYSGKTYTLTPVVEGAVGEEVISLNLTDNSKLNAGDYNIIAVLDAVSYPNYQMTTVNKEWSIEEKEIGLTWAFDGTSTFSCVYDGAYHEVTATATGVIGEDKVKVTIANGRNRLAEKYTATATSVDNPNYTLPAIVTQDYEIEKRVVAFTWKLDGQNITTVEYNGLTHSVIATVSNPASGDNVTVTYSGQVKSGNGTLTNGNTATDKSTYVTVVASLSDEVNYALPTEENRSIEWTITPIMLDITFKYDSGLVYNGNAQGVTAVITKIASTDLEGGKVSFETEGTTATAITTGVENSAYNIYFKSINASTHPYQAIISAIVGEKSGNYGLPQTTSCEFTISPLTITLSWNGGDCVYNTQMRTVSANVTNLISGDSLSLTYKTVGNTSSYSVVGANGVGNIAKDADAYATTITAVDNTNYTLVGATNLVKSWTISAKEITAITWSENEFEYNGTPRALIATVANGATTDDDGKIYTGDTLALVYMGEATTNYGAEAINGNTATNAGIYNVTISDSGNRNYSISDAHETLTITQLTLSASYIDVTDSDITDRKFIYNGKAQGIRVAVSGIVSADNNDSDIALSAVFNGTIGGTVRENDTLTQDFTAINASSEPYALTLTLGGAKKGNYIIALEDQTFTISKKEITTEISAEILANDIVYDAYEISDSDLNVVFNNLITGESLSSATDFTVTYKVGDNTLATNPKNVGSYLAVISLNNTVTNYKLTGTTEFSFNITEYVITPSMITWTLGGVNVNLNSLTYQQDQAKTIVASINDTVFNVYAGKSIAHTYFGFCTCGANANSATAEGVDLEHQHFLNEGEFQQIGPSHAGTYWVTLSLSGGDSENFRFEGF